MTNNQAAATNLKSGCEKVKNWPLSGNLMAIWDKICCMLAALGGCTLNRGYFACKFIRGDMLIRVGCNCRWDCIIKYAPYLFFWTLTWPEPGSNRAKFSSYLVAAKVL